MLRSTSSRHHQCTDTLQTSQHKIADCFLALQALAATTRSVLSAADAGVDAAVRDILAASAAAIQDGISQGVYGTGQGRAAITEHQVATMQS